MTRHARYRSRSASFVGYRRPIKFGAPNGPWTAVTLNGTAVCNDSVGSPVVDSALDITSPQGVCRVNGKISSTYAYSTIGSGYEFDDVPVRTWSGVTLNTDPIPAPAGWYLDVVARTNPSRPVLTIPTLVQDLIDLPAMLRHIPSMMKNPQRITTAKGVSNAYLETLFGWMPFVEDIKQLLDLQAAILKRNAELANLYSAQGLRRRLSMGESNEVESQSWVYTLTGPNNKLTVPLSVTVKKRAWATIRWKPTSPPPFHPDDPKWNARTRDIVLGMTNEGLAKGLWDVIPWTWLVGWFTNIGKYTLAYSNTVPAAHSGACFMSSVEILGSPGVPYSVGCRDSSIVVTGQSTYVHKTRTVSGALTPGFNMPFLDMSRLSVLGALTVQRIAR